MKCVWRGRKAARVKKQARWEGKGKGYGGGRQKEEKINPTQSAIKSDTEHPSGAFF